MTSQPHLPAALDTRPAHRPAAESAVAAAYRAAGMRAPEAVRWCSSPFTALLDVALLLGGEAVDTAWGTWSVLDDGFTPDLLAGLRSEPVGARLWDGDAPGQQQRPQVLADVEDGVQRELDLQVFWVGWGNWNDYREVMTELLGWLSDAERLITEPIKWAVADVFDQSSWVVEEGLWEQAFTPTRAPGTAACSEVVAAAGCWWWPLDRVTVLAERPSVVRVDGDGRLHADGAPAVAWQDGFGVHVRHGWRAHRRGGAEEVVQAGVQPEHWTAPPE